VLVQGSTEALPASRGPKKGNPPNGGVLSNSALAGVLAGLLVRLIRLTALLRLALTVLFHANLQKIAETSFEWSSFKVLEVSMPDAN
jgi:hypothetical protein